MKKLLSVGLSALLALGAVTGLQSCAEKQTAGTFEVGKGTFLLNGEPMVVKAAEVHYPRIPEPYWEQRILSCKALGMNTLCLYVFWNLHEQEEGKFHRQQRYCGILSPCTETRNVCNSSSRTICMCRMGDGWPSMVAVEETGCTIAFS